jgi:class 3 adenylate cyclase
MLGVDKSLDMKTTLRGIAANHDRRVVKLLGDGAMIVFESARAAVRAGVNPQSSNAAGVLQVRVGIHRGRSGPQSR